MKYTIYQIRFPKNKVEENAYMKYAFRGLDDIDAVKFNLYSKVYTGDINSFMGVYDVLEEIFKIFNLSHPENFKGHSLSVSDIVKIDNKYYYCDSFGWKEVNI